MLKNNKNDWFLLKFIEIHWNSLKTIAMHWKSLKIIEYLWKYLRIIERYSLTFIKKLLKIVEFHWKSMNIKKTLKSIPKLSNSCKPIRNHWKSMKSIEFIENNWTSFELYEKSMEPLKVCEFFIIGNQWIALKIFENNW